MTIYAFGLGRRCLFTSMQFDAKEWKVFHRPGYLKRFGPAKEMTVLSISLLRLLFEEIRQVTSHRTLTRLCEDLIQVSSRFDCICRPFL